MIRCANARSGDEVSENHVVFNVEIDLNVLGVLIQVNLICDQDVSLNATMNWHILLNWKTKLIK